MVGRHGELDPRGLRVQGAVVVGQLDLDGVRCDVPARLLGCRFDEPVLALVIAGYTGLIRKVA